MAEQWRNSWRDRQRAEAGSAEGVPRDQASVATPLMAMQNNLSRRRATVSNNQKQGGRNKEPGFWIIVFMVVCLVGGLAVYIISTYLPNAAPGAAHVVPPSNETAQPALSLQGPQSATIKQAQILILHGEHFGANDTITFLLDGSTPIKDENGKIISVQATNAGRFDVPIPIQGSNWSVDSHYIQAVDDRTKQNAYLNIVVSPASTPEVTSPNLALSIQGKSVKKLTFNAVVGHGANQQRITLTNTSGSKLHWTATANADHNLSWLLIDDNHTAGNLGISGTDSIGISILTAGLKSNPPTDPYTGQIVFTINGQKQLTLPVELQLANPQPEIVSSPNPVVALLGARKTCQLTALTLINLGNSFIDWTLVPYDHNTKDHIQFMANGQSVTQGMLPPSGESGDTKILNLQCNGVSAGDTYKFTLYAGSASWLITIFIRTSS